MKYFKTIILEHPLQFEQLKSFLKLHLSTTWKKIFFVGYAVNQRLSLSERKCLNLSERYSKQRHPGALRGKIKISDDFDELPEDIAEAFGMVKP